MTSPALFVVSAPDNENTNSCLGILIDDPGMSSELDHLPEGEIVAWVDGNDIAPVTWGLVQEFGLGIATHEERVKTGFSAHRFSVNAGASKIHARSFLMPRIGQASDCISMSVTPSIRSLISLSDCQAWIWAEIQSAVSYEEFFGPFSISAAQAISQRPIARGDCFRFHMFGAEAFAGVAVIKDITLIGEWNIEAYFPFGCPRISISDRLISTRWTEFESQTAKFACEIGRVAMV